MTCAIPMRRISMRKPPLESRHKIIQDFWDCPISLDEFKKDPTRDDSYFAYFEEQQRLALLNDGLRTMIETHPKIIMDIITQLKMGQSRQKAKDHIATTIAGSRLDISNNDEPLCDAMDLAVRLWLMIRVGTLQGVLTGQTAINWSSGNIKEVLNTHFQHQTVLVVPIKLERRFNAMSLERIAGVQIKWSPVFVDHLLMKEDGPKTVVTIFHHASFLEYQQRCHIFPDGLIEETQDTLALLLPEYDQDTARWFKKKQSELGLDPRARRQGQLKTEQRQIDHFKFWHDRLIVIKQFFDDSEPRTVKQWWFDDRKRVQWFWVAIVVVVSAILFGIIQCIEGGWQIYMAYHPH